MTIHDAVAFVNRIEYKPGWRIAAEMKYERYGSPMLWITISLLTPDSGGSGTIITKGSRNLTDQDLDGMSEDYLLHFVFDFVMEAEHHEAAEFFRIGDRRPFDPHRGKIVAVIAALILLQSGGAQFTYDFKGNRTGEIKSAPGSYEVFDKNSNRIGTGRKSPYDESIRIYDPRSGQPLYEIRSRGKRR